MAERDLLAPHRIRADETRHPLQKRADAPEFSARPWCRLNERCEPELWPCAALAALLVGTDAFVVGLSAVMRSKFLGCFDSTTP